MQTLYKIPLVLEPQREGGCTITCPLIPELITEVDTMEEVQENVTGAFQAVLEAYEDRGLPLPTELRPIDPNETIHMWTVIPVPTITV